MNTLEPTKMTTGEKVSTIVRAEYIQWKKMDKQRLLDLLAENRRFFLETEADQGNSEYLDELLEEIDIQTVWENPLMA